MKEKIKPSRLSALIKSPALNPEGVNQLKAHKRKLINQMAQFLCRITK